nr:glycosyltransferase [uncultured Flavobacterium sp.]
MLAIVIPYYKFTFFEATLLSLSTQTDKRFKVYIGNDASSEDPSDLLERYYGKFDFIYHRFETNLGGISLVQQWERCIDMVAGEEWIMILGDDDTIGYNCVASFYEHIREVEQQKINVIRYATVVIDQNDTEISIVHTHPKYETSIDFLMRKFKGGTRSSLSEFIFKKDVFLEIKFKKFPLAWHSDILAVLEVSVFGLIYTINEGVVSFRWSGENITSREDNLILKNIGTFQFYYYLLDKKNEFFNSEQIIVLRERLEKTFLDNKKSVTFWVLFTKLYLSNFYYKNYCIFMGKMLKTISKIIISS